LNGALVAVVKEELPAHELVLSGLLEE